MNLLYAEKSWHTERWTNQIKIKPKCWKIVSGLFRKCGRLEQQICQEFSVRFLLTPLSSLQCLWMFELCVLCFSYCQLFSYASRAASFCSVRVSALFNWFWISVFLGWENIMILSEFHCLSLFFIFGSLARLCGYCKSCCKVWGVIGERLDSTNHTLNSFWSLQLTMEMDNHKIKNKHQPFSFTVDTFWVEVCVGFTDDGKSFSGSFLYRVCVFARAIKNCIS